MFKHNLSNFGEKIFHFFFKSYYTFLGALSIKQVEDDGERGDSRDGKKGIVSGYIFEIKLSGLADKLDVEYEGKEEVRVTSGFWFEQLSG